MAEIILISLNHYFTMLPNSIKNNYSISDYIKLLIFVIRSRLISSKIRIVRFPIEIRGKKWINFGTNLTTGYWCRLEAFKLGEDSHGQISFGRNVQLNDFVHISSIRSVKIGDNVLIASHVYISDNSHGSYRGDERDSLPDTPPSSREYNVAPVTIGNNVWIGEGVIVMCGVTIGDGCVIGAHSVVNRSIPENCIAVGSPVRIVKQFNNHTKHWEKV